MTQLTGPEPGREAPGFDGPLTVWPDSVLHLSASGHVLAYHRGRAADGIAVTGVVGRPLTDVFPVAIARTLQAAIDRALYQGALEQGALDQGALNEGTLDQPSLEEDALTEGRPQTVAYALPSERGAADRRYYEARIVPYRPGEVICITRDITEQRVAEQQRIRRELYFAALAQINHRLLTTENADEPYVADVLATLGYAAGATRAFLLVVTLSAAGELTVAGARVWRAGAGGAPAPFTGSDAERQALEGWLLPRWLPSLRSGRPVQALVDALDAPEREAVRRVSPAAQALVLLPILDRDRLVRVLGFEVDAEPRVWEDEEIHLLSAAAAALSYQIEREHYLRRLQASAEEIAQVNVELAEARDRANASSRAKSDFLAVIGHEIRTPLNPVIAMSELLLRTELSPQQQGYVQMILDAGHELVRQIGRILEYVELEAGDALSTPVPFSPAAAVEGVAEALKQRAHEKHLCLMTFCHPHVPALVLGDANRVQKVLMALVDNALKFTEEGEVIVRVERVRVEQSAHAPAGLSAPATSDGAPGPGDGAPHPSHGQATNGLPSVRLRFSVSDTGIGLPPGAEEWLFKPFTQADYGITRRYGGTGLGLATAKRIVDLLGGEIGAHAAEGGGTTFWFELPFARLTESQPTAQRRELAGLRALVVDDLESNRDIVAAYLRSWGVACDVAPGGAEALASLRQAEQARQPYHVAVVDLLLPSSDGVALARAIQQDPALCTTRLVMMTAYVDPQQAREAEAAGFGAQLTKPFRGDQLYRALVTAMATTPAAPPPAAVPAAVAPAPEAGRLAVLLLEGNAMVRRVAVREIERQGCVLTAAGDEDEALRALTAAPHIDLALIDLQRPPKRLIAALRAPDRAGPRTVLVGMAAPLGLAAREQRLALGLDAVIGKPLTPTALESLLARWFAASRAPSRPRPAQPEA